MKDFRKHERNIQEKIKRPNHQIKGIHEAGESQANGIDQIFNKMLEKKNFLILDKHTHTDTRGT